MGVSATPSLATTVVSNTSAVFNLGNKLDFLFGTTIGNLSQVTGRVFAYNAARAAANASALGIADTPENRALITQLLNETYANPNTIVGPGRLPGSNLRELFVPGVTGTGSVLQFVEQGGNVITFIVRN